MSGGDAARLRALPLLGGVKSAVGTFAGYLTSWFTGRIGAHSLEVGVLVAGDFGGTLLKGNT